MLERALFPFTPRKPAQGQLVLGARAAAIACRAMGEKSAHPSQTLVRHALQTCYAPRDTSGLSFVYFGRGGLAALHHGSLCLYLEVVARSWVWPSGAAAVELRATWVALPIGAHDRAATTSGNLRRGQQA